MKERAIASQYEKMTKTPILRLVIAMSVPSVISVLITNIYNLVDTAFVGQLGTSASGAVGIGQGFQPVAAFNYGAKKFARLRKAYRFTIIITVAITIVECAAIIAFSPELITLFRNDPEVIEIGTRALRLQVAATMVLPLCMCAEMLLQSTGRRLGATLLSSLRNGLVFIPALIILEDLWGLAGIQEAQPAALVLSLPFAIFITVRYFKKLPKTDSESA